MCREVLKRLIHGGKVGKWEGKGRCMPSIEQRRPEKFQFHGRLRNRRRRLAAVKNYQEPTAGFTADRPFQTLDSRPRTPFSSNVFTIERLPVPTIGRLLTPEDKTPRARLWVLRLNDQGNNFREIDERRDGSIGSVANYPAKRQTGSTTKLW